MDILYITRYSGTFEYLQHSINQFFSVDNECLLVLGSLLLLLLLLLFIYLFIYLLILGT